MAAEIVHSIHFKEKITGVGFNGDQTASFPHKATIVKHLGADVVDCAYSALLEIEESTNLDLREELTSILTGQAVPFPIITHLWVRNNSNTEVLTVGGSTNPWTSWLKASGDGIKVDPQGLFCIESPLIGYATSEGSADILTLIPSSETPISVSILILGRAE